MPRARGAGSLIRDVGRFERQRQTNRRIYYEGEATGYSVWWYSVLCWIHGLLPFIRSPCAAEPRSCIFGLAGFSGVSRVGSSAGPAPGETAATRLARLSDVSDIATAVSRLPQMNSGMGGPQQIA